MVGLEFQVMRKQGLYQMEQCFVFLKGNATGISCPSSAMV